MLRKLHAPDRDALAETGADLRRPTRTDASLATPLTSLVGRENDTSEVTALLAAHRLVTLVGPGGVGKTRLALRVATVHADHSPGGIRFVDLAPVDAGLVGDALARAFGVAPEPGWSLRDVLREVAAGVTGLLLIDNCEHVVADVADIVADLLSAYRLDRIKKLTGYNPANPAHRFTLQAAVLGATVLNWPQQPLPAPV